MALDERRPSTFDGLSEGGLRLLVYGLTVVVCGLVVVLIAFPGLLAVEGVNVSVLPAVHATMNGTTAVLLLVGILLIRAGNRRWHQRVMITAFGLSCAFLLSYVVYHSQAPATSFGGEGWVRPVYFTILISHIALAPVVLPLALFAVLRGLRGEFGRHRKVARWTFPVWIYVAVTGVIVYLMMMPYYAHG
jgi:putative membrane protein